MSKSYILSRMDWAKAYRDYEALKVGNENLEINSDFTQGGRTSKWSPVYGSFVIEKNQLKKTVREIALHNRIEFILSSGSYTDAETYTLTLWAEIPTFSQWERFENAVVLSQKTDDDFGVGIKKTMVTFKIINKSKASLIRFYTPSAPIGEVQVIDRYKLTEGEVSFRDEWTPSPKDINAQQFPAQVAQDIYTAKEGNWDKAEKDYELLKVGKRNLLPEVGEQVRYDLEPLEHSNNISSYTANILKSVAVSGKLIIFPEVKVESGFYYTSCDFSETEDNISVIYFYDKNGDLILNPDIINREFEGKGSIFSEVYKGFIHIHTKKKFGQLIQFRDLDNISSIRVSHGAYRGHLTTKDLTISNWKLERGDKATPFTPSPESINASPFTVKLAEDYYQQQSEITELRNAILQLGGQ